MSRLANVALLTEPLTTSLLHLTHAAHAERLGACTLAALRSDSRLRGQIGREAVPTRSLTPMQ